MYESSSSSLHVGYVLHTMRQHCTIQMCMFDQTTTASILQSALFPPQKVHTALDHDITPSIGKIPTNVFITA